MEVIQFEKGKQKEFLITIRTILNISFPKISHKINKSTTTFYDYYHERHRIPNSTFQQLCSLASFIPQQFTILENNSEHLVTLPPLSEKLAEFIGALAGDGHLRLKSPAELNIVTSKTLDSPHLYYLVDLFRELFSYEPKIAFQPPKDVIKMRFYSKDLVTKLHTVYDLPVGKKKGKLHIPQQILANKLYLIPYLRGLFDTDGSISRHHKATITHKESGGIVGISSRDKCFLLEVTKALESLGFVISLGYKDAKIYAKEEIDKFFKMIKPSNLKHNLKYKAFKEKGYVPLSKEIAACIGSVMANTSAFQAGNPGSNPGRCTLL